MWWSRRQFLKLGVVVGACPAPSRFAQAQGYPAKPVRWIVGFPPGGHGDISARLISQWLSTRLGQPFIVENLPGAAGNLATEAVAKAQPDGYTLLAVGPPVAINPSLYKKLDFDFMRDIAPVASFYRVPNVMAINASFPANTVQDFVAQAKSNPGQFKFASGGNGTSLHISGELFKMMTGIDIRHAPYAGAGPALADLRAGKVQVIFAPAPAVMKDIKAGTLRALAVTTAVRSPALPGVPTVGDTVPGYESSSWQGVGVPMSTPVAIVEKLSSEINAGLADPTVHAQLVDLGAIILASSSAEFRQLIADETEKWGNVIRFAGITPE